MIVCVGFLRCRKNQLVFGAKFYTEAKPTFSSNKMCNGTLSVVETGFPRPGVGGRHIVGHFS